MTSALAVSALRDAIALCHRKASSRMRFRAKTPTLEEVRVGKEEITSDNGKFDRTEYRWPDPPEQVSTPADAPADEFERM
ncbi:hypothetical protein ACQP2U_09705 [Nocardia sp. CA-084685]|uniref:hypothetical protein n=1 Tax=Nocardia sp. CA-084685 TaxID=3239970 RepID=UPI003D99985B